MKRNTASYTKENSMTIKPVRSHSDRRPTAVALSLALAVMVLACGGIGSVTSAVGSAATGVAAVASQSAPVATPVGAGVTANTQSSAKCQTIGPAYLDFEGVYPILGLASDGAYAANTPDSLTYINIPKLRTDLDVMGTLPDGELGPTAPAIAQIRQLVDQVDANFKSGGKPFSDGSGNGQKVIDLYLKLAQPYTVVSAAFAGACPHYSAATAAPDVAGYQLGQTASVGDLRVTLDKVAVAPPSANPLLQPGNRYLLAHVTIQNAGQSALQVTGMETSLKDGAGNTYGWDPFASSSAASDAFADGKIPAGATQAGLVSYQLPANAGDLLWIFQDYGQNRAVFAVKVSDIDTSNAGNAATQDALQNSAGATMTAFLDMAATADAANATADAANMTATPAP
jgi:hypothetical protein